MINFKADSVACVIRAAKVTRSVTGYDLVPYRSEEIRIDQGDVDVRLRFAKDRGFAKGPTGF
jgi:hypothetical protein